MIIFKIYMKLILRNLPLLILLVALQLVLGQISALAVSEKPPELGIVLLQDGEGELSKRYERSLYEIEGLNIISVESADEKERIFRQENVQGLVVISEDFDEKMHDDGENAVMLYPAPGVTDTSVLVEYLVSEILQIRAEIVTKRALEEQGVSEVFEDSERDFDTPILTIEYEGPEIRRMPFSVPPAYGVPAILLLLAFLHAVMIVPGRDNRRMMMKESGKIIKTGIISISALSIIWIAMILIYALGMRVFYDVVVSANIVVLLIGIVLYAIAVGSIVSAIGNKIVAVWIFIFWLLFNMTLGGGLWNSGVTNPLMIPLLPVSSVVSLASSGLSVVVLFASFVVGIAVFLLIVMRKGFVYSRL